jgi:hypothetical protein
VAGLRSLWPAFICGEAAQIKGLDVFDAVSISLALLVLIARIIWRKRLGLDPVFDVKSAIADFLTAAALVPFLLMIGASFNEQFFQQLVASAKGSISIAGGVGLIFLLRELLNKPK